MLNIARKLVSQALAARRLRGNSPLPRDMQRQVIKSFRTIDRLPDGEHTTELMGYRVTYRGASNIRFLFQEIFVSGDYYFEPDNARPTIIDCGSNIGLSVLFFKRLYPESKIIAFEPDPKTFAVLERNVRENGLSDTVCHQFALGDVDDSVDFYRGDDENSSALTMSTLHERMPTTKKISASGRKLSSFVDGDVDLLKLDVEGAELKVLTDLHQTGKLSRIKRMYLEYHHHIDTARDDLSTTLEILEQNSFGYQIKAQQRPWPKEAAFQDILIYCYKKNS